MKNALVYLLLLAILLPTISQWGTLAYYQVNRDYIARVLCENRDKPELHCDGQCYLAKQLKARQDKQDKETTARVQNMPLLQLFCQVNLTFQFNTTWVRLASAPLPAYRFAAYTTPLVTLFRPPRL